MEARRNPLRFVFEVLGKTRRQRALWNMLDCMWRLLGIVLDNCVRFLETMSGKGGSESLASIGTLEVAIGSSAIDVGASLFVVEACLGLSLCVELLRNSLGLVPGCSECNDTWLEIFHRPRPVAMLAMLHHSQPDTYRNTSVLAI